MKSTLTELRSSLLLFVTRLFRNLLKEVKGWETSQVFGRAWMSVVKLLASVCQSYSCYIRSLPPSDCLFSLPHFSFILHKGFHQTHTASMQHGSHPARGSSVALFQRALFLLSFWCSLPSSSGAEMLNVQLWYEFVPDFPQCAETPTPLWTKDV